MIGGCLLAAQGLSVTLALIRSYVESLLPPLVAVAGGDLHNLGQGVLAAIILDSGYSLPVPLLSRTLAGALVGLLAGILIQRMDIQ